MSDQQFSDDGWGDEEGQSQDYQFENMEEPTLMKDVSTVAMDVKEVMNRQHEITSELADLFNISQDQSLAILIQHGWQAELLKQKWFSETKQAQIRTKSGVGSSKGLFAKHQSILKPPDNYCLVCFNQVDRVYGIDRCGHQFCHICWSNFVKTQLDQGPKTASQVKCPYLGCQLYTPVGLIRQILSTLHESALAHPKADKFKKFTLRPVHTRQQLMNTFEKYLAMSFTDSNKFVRWCPRPGCGFAIQASSGHLNPRAKCKCGQQVCMKCGNEAHIPASCMIHESWVLKNQSEEDNITWISANTKMCPSCKKPIEKNQGCNRMQCRCGYQFCWLCMVEWEEHGGYSGVCNKYKAEEEQKRQNKREEAKEELNRYMFYFQRYKNHQKSREFALKLKPQLKKNMDLLFEIRQIPFNEMEFFLEAVEIVAEARQVLKWTYVHAFYLHSKKNALELLEFQQNKLDSNCDHLHEMLEKPFKPFFDFEDSKNTKFFGYKAELTNLYKVTQHFYENIVKEIEDEAI